MAFGGLKLTHYNLVCIVKCHSCYYNQYMNRHLNITLRVKGVNRVVYLFTLLVITGKKEACIV